MISLLLEYINYKYSNLRPERTYKNDGIKWKQDSQYIDKDLKADIELILGNRLSEFYWQSGTQFVYIKRNLL